MHIFIQRAKILSQYLDIVKVEILRINMEWESICMGVELPATDPGYGGPSSACVNNFHMLELTSNSPREIRMWPNLIKLGVGRSLGRAAHACALRDSESIFC